MFEQAYDGVDLDKLEAEFIQWVWTRYKQLDPKAKLPAVPAKARASVADASAKAPAGGARVEAGPVALAKLAPGWHARLGAAVHVAGHGELTEALAIIAAATPLAADGAARERLTRERSRMERLQKLRQVYLESRRGKVLELRVGSKRYRGRIDKVDNGAIHLKAGRNSAVVPLSHSARETSAGEPPSRDQRSPVDRRVPAVARRRVAEEGRTPARSRRRRHLGPTRGPG